MHEMEENINVSIDDKIWMMKHNDLPSNQQLSKEIHTIFMFSVTDVKVIVWPLSDSLRQFIKQELNKVGLDDEGQREAC